MKRLKEYEFTSSLTSSFGEIVEAELCDGRQGRFVRLHVNGNGADLTIPEVRKFALMLLDAYADSFKLAATSPSRDVTPDHLAALKEARAEIARLNQAAGETVFNPAATELIDAAIAEAE